MILYDRQINTILITFKDIEGNNPIKESGAHEIITGVWLNKNGTMEPCTLPFKRIEQEIKQGHEVEIPIDKFIKTCERTFGRDR